MEITFGGAAAGATGWRLSINGASFEQDTQVDLASARAEIVQLFGHETADVFLGDLEVGSPGEEPATDEETVSSEAEDSDASSVLDPTSGEDEESGEGSPSRPTESLVESTNINEDVANFNPGGVARVIFVDAHSGSDANDGFTPHTAKASISAAIAALDQGVVIVAPGIYVVEPISSRGKSITLRATGGVILKQGGAAVRRNIH